jgi:Ca-activated chloride channel homolog
LFEIVPRGVDAKIPGVDSLRYQPQPQPETLDRNIRVSNELLDLKIRYKDPDGTESKLLSLPLVDRGGSFVNASADFRFAAAVAGFGMILRDSPYRGAANMEWVIATASNSRGADRNGYRQEFVRLAQRAAEMMGR